MELDKVRTGIGSTRLDGSLRHGIYGADFT